MVLAVGEGEAGSGCPVQTLCFPLRWQRPSSRSVSPAIHPIVSAQPLPLCLLITTTDWRRHCLALTAWLLTKPYSIARGGMLHVTVRNQPHATLSNSRALLHGQLHDHLQIPGTSKKDEDDISRVGTTCTLTSARPVSRSSSAWLASFARVLLEASTGPPSKYRRTVGFKNLRLEQIYRVQRRLGLDTS